MPTRHLRAMNMLYEGLKQIEATDGIIGHVVGVYFDDDLAQRT